MRPRACGVHRACRIHRTGSAGRILLLGLCALWGSACARLPDSVVTIEQAALWQGVSETFPADASFAPVALRDRWGLARRGVSTQGWYRAHFQAPAGAGETGAPQAVWIEQLYPNGEVFVNGVSIGSGGRLSEPPARNRFRPVYLPFPATLLQPGTNTLWVRFVGSPGSIGVLSRIHVGPEQALWPLQQWTHFAAVDAVRVGFALALLLAAILALGARSGEGAPGNGWLAAGLLAFVVSGMSVFTADLPIPGRAVEWLGLVASHWTALLFAIGVARSLGHRGPVRAWIAGYVGLALVGLVVPALYLPALWFLWWIPSSVLCLAMLARMGRRAFVGREWRWAPGLVLVAVALGTPVLASQVPLASVGSAVVPFGFVAVVGGHLLLQLRDAQHESARLNRELEARVAARESELSENYTRLAELERERTVVRERQRITRDMHDGVGGHLVSALSQVRSRAGDPGTLERTLEEALLDLRLTIDAFQPGASDLPALLGGLRASLARRVEGAGLALRWRISDAGEERPLSPDALLHVIRFVQEAVTNAVRHSGGGSVEVATRADGPDVLLVVADDGHGGARDREGGSGLRHLRERAHLLGHPLEIESDSAGTRLRLRIPLPAGSATADEASAAG